MNGGWRALLRLFAIQGTWNYERMLGVGMGYAAEPLLEDLKTVDPVRHGEAVVRSAEFFNCNPNLAGLALGATARAEYEAVPGTQIARLRTALCSPLGALGDELFWAGLVPAARGPRPGGGGAGSRVVGDRRASSCSTTWPDWAPRSGRSAPASTPACGSGRRSAAPGSRARWRGSARSRARASAWPCRRWPGWYLHGFGWTGAVGALAVAAVGAAVTRWFGPALTSVRFALLAMALLLFFRWMGL